MIDILINIFRNFVFWTLLGCFFVIGFTIVFNWIDNLVKKRASDIRISKTCIFKIPLTKIGRHVAIDHGFYSTVRLQIGSYIHIAPYCTVIGGKNGLFVMEDFTGMSAGCRIICASDDYLGSGLTNPTIPMVYRANVKCEPVVLKKHSLLGTNVVVMPGVTIGEGTVVGANSLVTTSTEPWSVYVGSPAKKIKDRPKEVILGFEKSLMMRNL